MLPNTILIQILNNLVDLKEKKTEFLNVWLGKLVLAIPVYLELFRNITVFIPTSAL